jgi:hypothetical protein
MIANPKDLGSELEYFMSENVLGFILPHGISEDTDLVLVTRVMNRLLTLVINSTVPSSEVWASPLGTLRDWWEHICDWLILNQDSEHALEKVHEAGLIPLVERQIRFTYSSHPVHQLSHTSDNNEMYISSVGLFIEVLKILRMKSRYVGESIILHFYYVAESIPK